ncbi:ATP-grasp domain-containing protein [Vibrio vulnificus]|uniref:ATP-grasp domain-containing protein n=1 Tax=Vibrio vulnificus TaxID=672 RepID=UPI00102A3110|nr:ATP-grasp domain-containing protein [Vibrio vulnificus]EGR7968208.1 ATP-grasp domain-containing protein [Vibrio vulnificus]RZP72486.1 ATP-grasp domain-containing protein [Vibrio vulnificus]RZP73829.1 ATP-grasp domain-containing protein [Vibrio vulnificus]
MQDVTVVVSRNDYTSIVKDGDVITPLKVGNIIYVFSVHCSVIPNNTPFEELHLIELVNAQQYLADLLTSIGTRHRIRDVVFTGEEDLLPVAYAKQALGLPGVHPEQALLFRNKLLMKQRLAPTSIVIPAFSPASETQRLFAMLKQFGKLIIKPQDGYSSKAITVVSSPQALEHYLSENHECLDQYLAEEFIAHDMFHLDAVVANGDILFSTLGKYDQPLFEYRDHQWIVSRLTNQKSALHEQAKRALGQILKHFDTHSGVFHFEFFSDGESVVFCEIAMRPAGGAISEGIYEIWGIHLHEINVQLQLGIPFVLPELEDRHAAIMLLTSQQEGSIHALLEQDFLLQNGHSVLKQKQVGDKVTPCRFSSDSILNIVASNVDEAQLNHAIREIRSKQYYHITSH